MSKSRGVLLTCFGKRGYYYAAYNAAFSIKHHNPDIQICLLSDGLQDKYLPHGYMHTVFDYKVTIPDEILFHSGRVDPAFVKMNAIDFSPFDITLHMDVECMALHDISVVFDELEKDGGYFYTHYMGEWKLEQGREIPHMYWAHADDVWNHFNLPSEAILPSSNSSFMFWVKSPEAQALHELQLKLYEYPMPIDRLRYPWGGMQPDELYLNAAMALKGITGKPPRPYLFMGNESTNNNLKDIVKRFPFLCFFGNKKQSKPYFINWYDDCLHKWHKEKGLRHMLKYQYMQEDKHANKSKIVNKNPIYLDNTITEQKHQERAILYMSFFEPEQKVRREELYKVLQLNVACDEIEAIYLLTEQDITLPIESGKVHLIKTEKRPTYQDVIKEANKHADSDTITIIANADIYFDKRNIQLIKELNYIDTAYALSRWNVDADGKAKHFNYEWSQDTWIMRGNIPTDMNCDFIFGVPACDNRFAFELSKKYRRVSNPSYSIKTFHLHNSNIHNYSEKDRLHSPDLLRVPADGIKPYRKKRLLLIQKGKVGDIIICLPIAKTLSEEYLIDWLCPSQYHALFDYVNYVRAVDGKRGEYDRILDLSFGQQGAPEGWWQKEKHRFDSFVEAKYELAGVPIGERDNLVYNRNETKENALYDLILQKTGGEPYMLCHESSDYGSPIEVKKRLAKVSFSPIEGFTIFDWRKVILNAAEIHCIDSSLCNFVEVIPEASEIPKYYYKTDKVPNKWDETILNNNWERVEAKQMEAA